MPRKKNTDEQRRNYGSSELRTHCVSVRMNAKELADLDDRRGKYARGEYLRLAFAKKLPPPAPPEINRKAWVELSKSTGNLATLATAMRDGEYISLDDITSAVTDFRRQLIAAKKT